MVDSGFHEQLESPFPESLTCDYNRKLVASTVIHESEIMTVKEAVLHEIEELSDEHAADVLGFIKQLKLQAALDRSETAIASEAVLAKDWLRDEEDEAWRDL